MLRGFPSRAETLSARAPRRPSREAKRPARSGSLSGRRARARKEEPGSEAPSGPADPTPLVPQRRPRGRAAAHPPRGRGQRAAGPPRAAGPRRVITLISRGASGPEAGVGAAETRPGRKARAGPGPHRRPPRAEVGQPRRKEPARAARLGVAHRVQEQGRWSPAAASRPGAAGSGHGPFVRQLGSPKWADAETTTFGSGFFP